MHDDNERDLLSHVGDFYNDVKDIFFKDVWQGIRWRAGTLAADTGEKVADAIDETGSTLTSFIRVPIRAASVTTQTVVNVSTASTKAVYHTGAKGVSLIGDALKSTGSLLKKPFKKHNQ